MRKPKPSFGKPKPTGAPRKPAWLAAFSVLFRSSSATCKRRDQLFERALGDYIHERDGDTLFRFGNDTQVSATNFLALTEWHLGELERARQLIDGSTRRATELGHVASVASALFFKTAIESRRGDVPAARVAVELLRALTQEHNLKTYADLGEVYANWARGKQLRSRGGGAWAQAGAGVLSRSRQQERRAVVLRSARRA